MPIFSFVVPIYNDGSLAEDFCIEFEKCFKGYLHKEDIKEDVELLFINDGSKDDSMTILKSICIKYPFVKVVSLSRNFGQHIALSCGYKEATGDYVGMLNVDMQDPPNQIPLLLDYIKKTELDMVYGMREYRHSSVIEKYTSYFFTFILNKLTGNRTPLKLSTLRVMNRKFVNAYNSFTEKSRYIPGLEEWLGFKKGYVNITHQERKKGKSSYNFKKRLLMAVESIVSFSDIPLKLIAVSGICIAFIGFILVFYIIITKLFFINYQPGYTTSISVITFLGGVQILVIGLAALYIGRILKEVQNRPLYVINEKLNF